MADQIEKILWCPDCMTKHARDLLHHANARKNTELRKVAKRAFDISSKMLKVKDRNLYSEIRDLEHHTEDLLTGLRTERKKLTNDDCPTCGNMENALLKIENETKSINRGYDKSLNMKGKSLIGAFLGKGVSEATSMYVPGENFGVANKSLVNLGIGLGINALDLLSKRKSILPAKAIPVLVPMANFLIADEVGDIVKSYIPVAPPATAVSVAPRAVSVSSPSNGTVPTYSNGKHIFVD